MSNLFDFKEVVIRYLEFLIAEDFNISYDLFNEIIFTENIVSKEIIVVQNFSEQIVKNAALKNYLDIVISNINFKIITREDMYRTLSEQ
ncbi:hypothetical protein ASG22_01945 [Chryseobacterium sp. Leaf405]|uniref:hypothetical protein n=1 Tax=Chryseobacterium sp. Leaf405 TaxID=1736367 RepID=UPI0006FBCC5D|nr:hypothetical protein [Chryseobacterium sp. Leaf405]KQT35806.1 hypothetical protein ASG22_01945 [Chryseobacterium sp. Leaf405]